MFQDGEKHARRGYWGDILVSPYIALGIECEEESFFKKNNKQFTSVSMLTLKAPITTAADDKFCDIFPNLKKNKV